jgi:mannose-6-phosphate isomerase
MEGNFPQRTEKPWGYELLFALTPQYAGKLIYINRGHRLSLQYHREKDETLYIYQGKAIVEVQGKDGEMVVSEVTGGHCFRVPPNTRHRLKAIEDTVVFEVSTPELDDVQRIDDDYGRTEKR